MAAYVICEIDVQDPERYPDYTKLVPATLEPFGGEFIARGGETASFEGEAPKGRIVVIRFPSKAQAEAWWNSEAYQRAARIRRSASVGRIFVVDGVPEGFRAT